MNVDVELDAVPAEATFTTVDTHTAGEPTRILLDGVDGSTLAGDSVRARRDSFAAQYDWVRELLMREPRGHDDMFGAVVVDPHDDDADLGVFFLDADGYLDMCGHGTIGVVSALVELGELSPDPTVRVETPAGVVEARPRCTEEGVDAVTLRMVESFVYETVTVPSPCSDAPLPVDVVYAGNFFALVDADRLDGSLETTSTDALVEWGLDIRDAVNGRLDVVNPLTGDAARVSITEIYESGDDADRSIVVFGDGQVDRSPCGTGTCAKMTLLYETGRLSVGDQYVHESIIGTRFQGRIVETRERDGVETTVPAITGSARITGRHTFLKDPRDGLDGFSLSASDG